ncbi:MAG: hypothetical protein GX968_07725, partial [Tissierellia bacterium]|nr:hypothetical protein [Tissierellia bacterium]
SSEINDMQFRALLEWGKLKKETHIAIISGLEALSGTRIKPSHIGGIVGRQSGYIVKSNNYGKIHGRKDVGGIVGQMEPHISRLIQPSKLKELQGEINNLQGKITSLINNAKISSDIISEDLLKIQEHLDDGQSHIQSLVDQTEDLINQDIEEINRISVIGAEILDRMVPIIEEFTNTMEIMEEAIPPIKRALKAMSRAMGEVPYISKEIEDIMESLDYTILQIIRAQNKAQEAFKELEPIVEIIEDEEIGLGDKIDKVMDILKTSGKLIGEAVGDFEKGMFKLIELEKNIRNIMDSLDYISNNMEYGLDSILKAINIMEDAMDNLIAISKDVEDILEYVSKESPLEFATTDDLYQETKEDLFDTMGNVTNSLSQFIKNANLQGDLILNDIEAISDQLFLVMNLMFNMIEEVSSGEVELEDIVQDVSRYNVEEIVEGKVSQCKNLGSVEADLNVGGIAGAMSIKLSIDPEEDINISSKLPTNTVFETKAVIHNCENHGDITGKKDYIGGIVGRMDLGYIQDAMVSSSIISSSGNYVGGIAEESSAPIVSSYVKSHLTGGNYVGGITGFGKEIRDS